MNCGTVDHATECLCDVVIPSPVVATVSNLSDTFYGKEIVHHLDIAAPFSRGQLADFFEFQTGLKDKLDEVTRFTPPGARPPGITNIPAKVTPEMSEFIANRVMSGDPSPVIRGEVERLYGVRVSASHMSHLRKRLVRSTTL